MNAYFFTSEEETLVHSFKVAPTALMRFGLDLTALAKKGELLAGSGREKELSQLMEILLRKQKNNPVLIGNAGVGKTAIVELLAIKIVNSLVPFTLKGKTIISLDLAQILAGASYRGDFEKRLQEILSEALANQEIIIFIDEIHTIVGAGAPEGSLDAANILKPILSRSGFQCIGSTTLQEYKRIEKDPALNRRFQPIIVKEPSIDEAIQMLYGLRPSLEYYHNVIILSSALHLAVELSAQHIPERFLPDKAIDILDRASAREVLLRTTPFEGSLIASIVQTALKSIISLKFEAFRRGDIITEFLFKQIEDAYKDCFLSWIERPLEIKDSSKVYRSLPANLVSKLQSSLLVKMSSFLFSSPTLIRMVPRVIICKYLHTITNKQKKNINLLYKIKTLRETFSEIQNLSTGQFKIDIFLRKKDFKIIKLNRDSCSEHNRVQINIVNEFLKVLKPLFDKAVQQSIINKPSSISKKELSNLYALLGNTDYNKNFFSYLETSTLTELSKNFSREQITITEEKIRLLVSDLTEIPLQTISSQETKDLINLEITLQKHIVGQEEALIAISRAIRRARLGLKNPNRPTASFLFCGPTGVGKTEIAKTLAITMFGSEKELIRFDMSEFMEKFTVSRLVGSPPGYIGFDEGGQLTDAVRRKPYSVVLFDEIEKAHPDILNLLLQILEDGRLTDNKKQLISFKNTIVILTSNTASQEIQNYIELKSLEATAPSHEELNHKILHIQNNIASDIESVLQAELETFSLLQADNLSIKEDIYKKTISKTPLKIQEEKQTSKNILKKNIFRRLSETFLPEFLNRLDDVIIFEPLTLKELRKICDLMIKTIIIRVQLKNIDLSVANEVKTKLTEESYDPTMGARPLRRLLTKHIEDLIAEYLLEQSSTENKQKLHIYLNEESKIIIKRFL